MAPRRMYAEHYEGEERGGRRDYGSASADPPWTIDPVVTHLMTAEAVIAVTMVFRPVLVHRCFGHY